jgi:arylsulfatase A-like enzyme
LGAEDLMDLTRILEQLYAERNRLRQAIATLEQFQQGNITPVAAPSTRGRKSMGAEERKAVAERMKAYWAKKRQLDTKQSKEDS